MDPIFSDVEVTLRDRRVVQIRAMRPSDEPELLQAFDRLSPDARYMRFMRVVREPDKNRLRRALTSFPEKGMGIVATIPASDGIDIVGSALFMIGSDPSNCEFAISVAAEFGGAGLATALMNALIDTAKRRGLRSMEGFVLADNKPMLRIANRLGFSIDADPEDRTVRICHLCL